MFIEYVDESYWASQADQKDIGFLFGLDGALGIRTELGWGAVLE